MTNAYAIIAQTYENYGDTEQPYWKPKGARTFIFKGKEGDLDGAIECVNTNGGGYRANVLSATLINEGDSVGDPWDTIYTITVENGKYIARCDQERDEYSYWNSKVTRREHTYTMSADGGIHDSVLYWTFQSGNRINAADEEAIQKELA